MNFALQTRVTQRVRRIFITQKAKRSYLMEKERNEGEITIDLGAIFSFILHKWWIVVLSLVVGLVGGFGIATLTKHDTYSTNAVFIVSYYDGSSQDDQYSYQSRVASMLGGCVTLIRQNRFAGAVSDELEAGGNNISQGQVMSSLTYSFSVSGSNTNYAGNYIYITSTADSPQMAYDILVAASSILSEYISENYILAGSSESLVFNLANDIEVPTTPVSDSSVLQYTLIGGAGLAVVAIVVLAVIEIADKRVKGEDDLVSRYNIAVLGSVPDFEDKELLKGGYYYGKEE